MRVQRIGKDLGSEEFAYARNEQPRGSEEYDDCPDADLPPGGRSASCSSQSEPREGSDYEEEYSAAEQPNPQ
ncbi:MAG: hypothetical protein AMXMBFR77_20050 [Phycisphaerales bacterium]